MNVLLVIRSLCLCKDCWNRYWADMATHYVEMYYEKLFWHPKKRFWREINAISPQCYHKWIKIMLIWGMCNPFIQVVYKVVPPLNKPPNPSLTHFWSKENTAFNPLTPEGDWLLTSCNITPWIKCKGYEIIGNDHQIYKAPKQILLVGAIVFVKRKVCGEFDTPKRYKK